MIYFVVDIIALTISSAGVSYTISRFPSYVWSRKCLLKTTLGCYSEQRLCFMIMGGNLSLMVFIVKGHRSAHSSSKNPRFMKAR